ncbi:hypothetical protein [Parabacteroides sp.]
MKSDNQTTSFYTTVLATLLKEWREQNLVTAYAVAKAINASSHTITRFEQLKGGVSLEVGLRYLEFAETHISHPNIFGKFQDIIVNHKTEEEQLLYIIELKHRRHAVAQREQEERRQREERIRKSVVEEFQTIHNSNIQLLTKEKQELEERIANLVQENTVLKKINQDVSSENSTKENWLSKLKKLR